MRFSKEGDEEQKHKISVHLRLELEVAREIFRIELTHTASELERGVKGMVDFFNEGNERANIVIAQTGSRIVPFEFFD